MPDTHLLIGQVAGLLGITPKTIRHYHKVGLLAEPQRTPNGYRQYQVADLYHLLLIRRMQKVGLSLSEIKSIVRAEDQNQALHEKLSEVRDGIREKIEVLNRQLGTIDSLLQEDVSLAEVGKFTQTASPTYQMISHAFQAAAGEGRPALSTLDRKFLEYLDSFHWGDAYQRYWKKLVRFLIEDPEKISRLNFWNAAMEEAAGIPPDDPRLVEIADSMTAAPLTFEEFWSFPDLGDPINDVFKNSVYAFIEGHLTESQKKLIFILRNRLTNP